MDLPQIPPAARRAGRAARLAARALGALLAALVVFAAVRAASAQTLLVPMDDGQRNHLRAYGLVYNALRDGQKAEWLLNYRGGSYFLPDLPELRRRAALAGVSVEPLGGGAVAEVRRELAGGNMDAVPLEKAPKVAIYTPPGAQPWDDAVTLALTYAGIPFEKVWDDDVLAGKLSQYEWVHLFHEDFTGQQNKLYLGYSGAPWFVQQRQLAQAAAARHGLATVPALKKAVADQVRQYVERGGFLFAMCGATESLDLAVAGRDVDFAGAAVDGSPADPDADARMQWARSFAFRGAHLAQPFVNALSDIDGHQVNVPGRRQRLGSFQLFAFSAKFDPVATMLVQDHRAVLSDFYGVTTSFNRAALKPGVTVLATEEGAPWVKYIHGDYGKGAWTFLGGHDPEDAQHAIGSPPTDLSLHPNSPGYRLILNNVLFPAAKKKPLKT
jgi:hypothetical protein